MHLLRVFLLISSTKCRQHTRITKMDFARNKYPKGLPCLQDLINSNDSSVPPETAWIWGTDDEVPLTLKTMNSADG